MDESKESRTNVAELREGAILSRTSKMTVTRVSGGSVGVRNEAGKEWRIDADIVAAECHDTETVAHEVSVTLREMERVFASARDAVLSVTFTKALDPKKVAEEIVAWNAEHRGEVETYTKVRRAVTGWLRGEERRMHGYLLQQLPDGRWEFQDMRAEGEHKRRLVDPRTTTSITLRGVRYTIKKR